MSDSRVRASGSEGSWRGAVGDSTHRKVTRRLLPILIVFYILAYIGRSNLGYAALTMNTDLGISDAAFGLVAGIFFVAYFIFEVPSNILLDRFGARKWIARILVTWGIVIWTPLIIERIGEHFTATSVGLLTAATYVLGAVAMVLWGRSSDRRRERRWHTIIPTLLCALSLVTIGFVADSLVAVVFLAVIIATVYALFGPFWSLQTYFLTGATAVVGIAMINSCGNLAGFVSPYLIGLMSDWTGNQYAGFYVIAALMVIAAAVLAKSVRNDQLRKQEDMAQAETARLTAALGVAEGVKP